MLQALISDFATVIHQYCDGVSNKSFLIRCPDASSVIGTNYINLIMKIGPISC